MSKTKTLALLLLFSVMVTYEGVIRVTNEVGTNDVKHKSWDGDDDDGVPIYLRTTDPFPPVAKLIGGVFEVLFGTAGLALALAGLLYNFHNPMATMATIGTIILGVYTFAIYVFAEPIYNAANELNTLMSYPDENDADAASAIGILGSFALCAALQGGQFFFAADLLAYQQDKSEDRQKPGFIVSRYVYYAFLLLLFGTSQLAMGAFVFDLSGGGRLGDTGNGSVVIAPPFFVVWPELTITVGCFTTLVALIAIVRAATKMTAAPGPFAWLVGISWLMNLTMTVISAVGLINTPALTFVASMLFGLITAVHVLPVYLDAELVRAEE
jgi:hypothetical protein